MGFVPTVVFVALAGSAAMVKYDVVIESEWFDNIDVLGSGAAQKFAFAVYTGPFMLWWLPYGLMQAGSAWGASTPSRAPLYGGVASYKGAGSLSCVEPTPPRAPSNSRWCLEARHGHNRDILGALKARA